MIWRAGHLLRLAVRPDHFAGCQGVHSRHGGVQVVASTTVVTVAVLPVRPQNFPSSRSSRSISASNSLGSALSLSFARR
jgi:hypothetical protein